jgi:hypothetical protein
VALLLGGSQGVQSLVRRPAIHRHQVEIARRGDLRKRPMNPSS